MTEANWSRIGIEYTAVLTSMKKLVCVVDCELHILFERDVVLYIGTYAQTEKKICGRYQIERAVAVIHKHPTIIHYSQVSQICCLLLAENVGNFTS